MQQRELGNTGLMFKAIGLGAMPLSISGRPDGAQAFSVIEAFVGDGGNFIDTANVYCLDDEVILLRFHGHPINEGKALGGVQ
ncbi:MAG: hypothetical protein LM522_02795 [Candidatus Contendobacter sp.]|nr:hypothetical protein [Candidatus Contendobacter sp.]